MRKVVNPYLKYGENHYCFGCSPANKTGLSLEFLEEDGSLFSEWKPSRCYSGFTGVLHGGIQATLLDEIAAWVVATQLDTSGVTTNLNIKYRKPVKIENETIKLKANVQSIEKKFVVVYVELKNAKNEICTTGEVTYRIFPKELAMKKLYYPGKEAFFEKK